MKFLIVLLALPVALHAELLWDKTTKRVTYEPGTKSARVEYTYTNRGKQPVRVLDIKSGCVCCTAGSVSRKLVNPGESGVVKMRVDYIGKTLPMTKAVVVSTDDGKHTPLLAEIVTADGRQVKVGILGSTKGR